MIVRHRPRTRDLLLLAPLAAAIGCITAGASPLCEECADDDLECKKKACGSTESSTGTTDPTTSTTGVTTVGTVTTDPTATTSSSSSSTTDDTSSSSTSGPPCDHDLQCDPDEDLASCLGDCAVCNADTSCDAASETPYSCPQDCPSTSCSVDGALDPLSEQCDDGNSADDDACTNACNLARCGDGLLFPADNGGSESCDDQNLDPGDGCDPTCNLEYLLVFVSSTKFEGNLLPALDAKQGLDLADAHCQALAQAASHPGTFKAWLSDDAQGPASRFGLSPSYSGHFVLADGPSLQEGTLLAAGLQDLLDGSLAHPIDVDENGNSVSSSSVWTNTKPDGTPAGADHCSKWSSSSGLVKGRIGLTELADSGWTNFDQTQCSNSARIYCFQLP